MVTTLAEQLGKAHDALDGLSVGDAFGRQLDRGENPASAVAVMRGGSLPPGPSRWGGDTLAACSVLEALSSGHGIETGVPALDHAGDRFGADRSHGVAASRTALIGAYHCHDMDHVVSEAEASAQANGSHREAVACAVAVAVAAAICARGWASADADRRLAAPALLSAVAEHTHEGSRVRAGLERAARIPHRAEPLHVSRALGCAAPGVTSGTVSFALWCAAGALGSFEDAFWRAAAGAGDRGAAAAVACAVVAAGGSATPAAWLHAREPLPPWIHLERADHR